MKPVTVRLTSDSLDIP